MADSESADICCLIVPPGVLLGDSKGFACALVGGRPGSVAMMRLPAIKGAWL